MALAGRGRGPGTGMGAVAVDVVVDVVDNDVEDCAACSFFSERVEYMAAVTLAPVAALTAAMIAIVVLDIVKKPLLGWLGGLYLLQVREVGGDCGAYDHDRDIDAREGFLAVLMEVSRANCSH